MKKIFSTIMGFAIVFSFGISAGVFAAGGFRDVHDGHWGINDIIWASDRGLITGSGGNFRPDEFVTRAEFAAIMHRFSDQVSVEKGTGIDADEFQGAVESAIETYIKKQEEEARTAQEEANKPKKIENVSIDDDPILGDKNAPVTIVEFSDYECPFCARHAKSVAPEIIEKYVDTGKVKIVFRDLPLAFHKNAMSAAMAANCARDQGGDKKYFEMHDYLFMNQESFGDDGFYENGADSIGLDPVVLAECIASKKHKAEIEADMKDAESYGISGTPGFLINGWQIKGAYPFSEFEKYIEMELK